MHFQVTGSVSLNGTIGSTTSSGRERSIRPTLSVGFSSAFLWGKYAATATQCPGTRTLFGCHTHLARRDGGEGNRGGGRAAKGRRGGVRNRTRREEGRRKR